MEKWRVGALRRWGSVFRNGREVVTETGRERRGEGSMGCGCVPARYYQLINSGNGVQLPIGRNAPPKARTDGGDVQNSNVSIGLGAAGSSVRMCG